MAQDIEDLLDRPEAALLVTVDQELSTERLRAISRVADGFEFRADCFPRSNLAYLTHQLGRLSVVQGMTTVLTIRNQAERGLWLRPEQERRPLFNHLIPRVDAVDIERRSASFGHVVRVAKHFGVPVIASQHDFKGTPSYEDMAEWLDRALEGGATYFKIAAQVRTKEDLDKLYEFTIANVDEPIITVAMGGAVLLEYLNDGLSPRITLPIAGSCATYAHSGTGAVAPGQLDYLDTNQQLRLNDLDYDRLFDPISGWKLSPAA